MAYWPILLLIVLVLIFGALSDNDRTSNQLAGSLALIAFFVIMAWVGW